MEELMRVEGLRKRFGRLEVLKDVSFTVDRGDVIAIIGPSGAGKSTILRCLIDLEKADGGTILVEGEALVRDGTYAPAQKARQITAKMGMVFQSFNLFPHLSVRRNLTMPLVMVKKVPQQQADQRARELLEKVGLGDKLEAMPSTLSGGQKQRVAIARALMLSPDILLFDEPTSALDPQLTAEVLGVMRQLAADHVTMVVVTHEMSFAREAANKVLFDCDGGTAEAAAPQQLFLHPRDPRVAAFLGAAAGKN